MAGARREIDTVLATGGAVTAVESGYMKSQLVAAHAERRRRIESGEQVVVGVNRFTATEPSPLTAGTAQASVQSVDPDAERAATEALRSWRERRDTATVAAALERLRTEAKGTTNLVDASIACARAGVTTGEWAGALREVFGEYRATTGVGGAVGVGATTGVGGAVGATAGPETDMEADMEAGAELARVRSAVQATGTELGRRLRLLVAKPGLDGHSNGVEQVAVRARDCGFEVVYQGIRLTPAQIVAAAIAEDVHCVGVSVLSGAHLELVPQILTSLRDGGAEEVAVVVGGIIPAGDAEALRAMGVAEVFTPKDYGLTEIIGRLVPAIRRSHGLSP